MTKREIDFIDEVTSIIGWLDERWFDWTDKSPEGLNYACEYCDMHCSSGDHDEDCLARLAHESKSILAGIDRDDSFKRNMFGVARKTAEVLEVQTQIKLFHVMGKFYPKIMKQFPPLDYADPACRGCVCGACAVLMAGQPWGQYHHSECPVFRLAEALKKVL